MKKYLAVCMTSEDNERLEVNKVYEVSEYNGIYKIYFNKTDRIIGNKEWFQRNFEIQKEVLD